MDTTSNPIPINGCDLADIIRLLYIDERKTMREIGKVLGLTASAVHYRMKKLGIQPRDRHDYPVSDKVKQHAKIMGRSRSGVKLSEDTKNKMSIAKAGRLVNPSEYGGHIKNRRGYRYVYVPTHPLCSSDGYVMEHRLVMEKHIGRYLRRGEVVHHINGNIKDNRVENLIVMTQSEHVRLHNSKRKKGAQTA